MCQYLDMLDELDALVTPLLGLPVLFKIPLDLLMWSAAMERLAKLGVQGNHMFFDPKLLDISNTVRNALRRAIKLYAPTLMTCHTIGSDAMLKTLVDNSASTTIVGVTVPTNIDNDECNGTFRRLVLPQALMLANKGWNQGIRHFVSSPNEVAAIKRQHPTAFCITPGVRFAGTNQDDQKRVDTPCNAIRNGADMLVVGRPITQSRDPAVAAATFLDAIDLGFKHRRAAA